MNAQKAGNSPRLRLRHEMRRFVESRAGRSQAQRIDAALSELSKLGDEWSATNVRKAMGLEKSEPDWLPRAQAVAVFCRTANVNAHWLLTGVGEARPMEDAIASHVRAQLGTHRGLRLAESIFGRLDGAKLLAQVVELVRREVDPLVREADAGDAFGRIVQRAGNRLSTADNRATIADLGVISKALRLATDADRDARLEALFGEPGRHEPRPKVPRPA